ncbi:hypothetical protein AWB82_02990 [Caballeronia glebae]|uniref:Uncharacterized protein n=1 Tax=Caballeronia glebae TaxID=1777143 RepID=A0A158AWG8_9BURK|nr:hypothetical protein [Caballeronia glebae]SAK61377.1 hypothetical protein AWB82_02990 [Caballeronia glebae]
MIIGNEQEVTRAVLDELAHAPDARFGKSRRPWSVICTIWRAKCG